MVAIESAAKTPETNHVTHGISSPTQRKLSQITPIGEASRGHRYRITATWYVVGAVVGQCPTGFKDDFRRMQLGFKFEF